MTNKQFLLEYISNPLIWFKDFINSSEDEKALHIAYDVYDGGDYFEQYKSRHGLEDDLTFDNMNKDEIIQYGRWLICSDLVDDATRYAELPSWFYMSNASIVKNSWLIHATGNIKGIAWGGFQYGIEDYTKLGLTTWFSDTRKARHKNEDFYAFAFTPKDFNAYWTGQYGEEFIMFVSSGVRVYHNTDSEYQTIFSAREAKNFVPIYNIYGSFGIKDKITRTVIHTTDSSAQIVQWVIDNFNQYRKRIVCRERNDG